jgi:hypothetical protein
MMKIVVIIINFIYMTSGRIIFNFSFKKSQNSLGITTQQNAKSANLLIYIYIYIILPFRRLQLKGSNTIEKEL